MRLEIVPGVFAIARMAAADPLPAWAEGGAFTSVTRTGAELSIVCEAPRIPPGIRAEPRWRCLRVAGPLDFALVGVLASIAAPLAAAGVPIFCVSSFDTDHILVRAADLELAIKILESAGHTMAI